MSKQSNNSDLRLFMVLLGCRPPGRLTEQHDVFFGIATSLKDLVPAMKDFWPEAKGVIHIDCWREVTSVDGHAIKVIPKTEKHPKQLHLFFINLGGYKPSEFEEYHYKLLVTGKDSAEAITKSKKTAFYKHYDFKAPGGASHIDDKFGIDTDDIFKVSDALSPSFKEHYSLSVGPQSASEDELHIGYLPIKKLLAS
ncbi:MAG: hypothetical protein K0S12_1018 [Bacteroidetes bacterium]|jgi:hypothetical protein|nr:hypothetical protein [Bacteroidota bacterium]